MLSSARNELAGIIAHVKSGFVLNEIELKLPGGDCIIATITSERALIIGLHSGGEAIAMIDPSAVIVVAGNPRPLKFSARNQLHGVIRDVSPGPIAADVLIGLKGNDVLSAVVPNQAVRDLELSRGRAVDAVFKASSVIVCIPA